MTVEKVRSVCPYCGVGCGVVLDVDKGRIVGLTGDRDHPANRGRLCTKGKTAHQAIAAPGRLATALRRSVRSAEQESVPVADAILETGRRLRHIVDTHGPDAVALYVSGQMSIEAQYLVSKLAKGFLRTRHIESNSRLCMASAGTGYKLSLGADAPPGSYDDFDHTDLFFVIGANVADCHPILFLRMMDRLKQGAKLIVVDPRRSATAEKADLFLAPRPGSDLALLNGLLHLIVEAGGVDEAFISSFTEGWDVMPAFLGDYSPGNVAQLTGLEIEDIRRAADMIMAAGEFMTLWTMGLNQSVQGTFNTNAICNLHLATGRISRTGSGPFSLTGQPNAMGGREMGYMGPGLPGQRSALVEADRAFCEARWNLAPGTIRAEAGAGTIGMFEAMRAGEVRALWVICTNPVASVAGRNTVIEALERAEFVVTQDVFTETETNAYADIVLPGATSFEGDGVMVNSERNMVLTRKAAQAPGGAMPDWQIIAGVACAMGYAEGFSYPDAAAIFDEITGFSNAQTGYDLSGVSHERLRDGPVQWPAARGSGARNPLRYRTGDGGYRFATPGGKARFWPRTHIGPAERPDDDFPFILNTGRLQHQWHTMTKTARVGMLVKLNPRPFVEINPRDAARAGIAEGDRVELKSRRGVAVLPATITDRVMESCLFAPFHWNDLFGVDLAVNAVTSDATDPLSLQPEFKVSAVALRKLAKQTPAPIMEAPVPDYSFNALKPELASISAALGLGQAIPLELDADARQWLSGFMLGLNARTHTAPQAPALPDSAPLPGPARILVEGMLAGLYSGHVERAPPARAAPQVLTVLFASQTGNAEACAEAFAGEMKKQGREVRCCPLDGISPAELRGDTIIFASTFGDGDPPDNAAAFRDALMAAEAPRLEGVRYAVIAFGDSTYGQFCGFGTMLDKRLEELGASRLAARTDCDVGEEEKAAVAARSAMSVPVAEKQVVSSPVQTVVRSVSRDNPALARLVVNRLLSVAGGSKEVRQFSFETAGDVTYEAGDALGIIPENCPDLVAGIIDTLGLSKDAPVTIAGHGEVPFQEALTQHLEIARPSADFLKFWAAQAKDPLPGELVSGERAALERWLWGRQIADLLLMFPVHATAAEFCGLLRKLQPRLYSIASSPRINAARVDLTVSVVRHNHYGIPRKGVASTFVADRCGEKTARLFVQTQAHFRPPAAADVPAIMVGPGTGIAPFRAFLQEREMAGAKGRNWLFFGEQHRDNGFYYADELEAWQKSGHLTRLDTAFSRDQADKIYVQDRMMERGAELWTWLQEGAHFYVCGDASRMAKDVDTALAAIVETHGGMSSADARAFLRQLAVDRRYARDVY